MFGQSPDMSAMNAFYTFIIIFGKHFFPKQLSEYSVKKQLVNTVYKDHGCGPERMTDE